MSQSRALLAGTIVLTATLMGAPRASADTVTHTVDWGHSFDVSVRGVEIRRSTIEVDGVPGPGTVVRVEIPGDARSSDITLAVQSERELVRVPELSPDDPLSVETGMEALGEPRRTSEGYAYWMLPDGDVRGHRIAHVLVMPFREDETGGAHLLTRFDVQIETSASDRPVLARKVAWPRIAAADARFVEGLLDAPGLTVAPGVPASRASVPPVLEPVLVEQVIVTTAALESAYQEMADIKTRSGIPTRVTTVEWIDASYEGTDLAARIRTYLRDVYLYQGLRYAILAGDTDLVPERIAINRFQASAGVEVIAELYFAALDGTWNDDGDDRLGEAPDLLFGIDGDDVDLYAEIALGRVPSASLQDAEAFVAKWKSYTGHDLATFNDDYQDRILSLGEVLFPSDWTIADGPDSIVLDGSDLCESTLTHVDPTFERYRMYQYWQNPATPGAVPEVKEDVIDEINEGYGIIDHVGHGFRTIMSIGSGSLTNQDADAFTNTNRYSVLYAVNCTSGAVSFDSICEHLINNPTGGVVGSISSTDLDFPTISDDMKYRWFEAIFVDGVTRIGDAFTVAHSTMLPAATYSENVARWTIMTHILMGDPALEIWRSAPRTFTLDHAPTMFRGAASFTVTVTDQGVPVEGATVCLFKDDGYAVAETDAAGVASLAFSPDSEGMFQITATKNSYVPATQTAEVIPAATALVRVDEWLLHDGAGGGVGNGDGSPDAGESIVADLVLRNDGSGDATQVTATFHAGSVFITATDSTAATALVGTAEPDTIFGAFSFDVSSALPDTLRHVVVPARVDLAANEGSWDEAWWFNANQRLLDLTRLDWSILNDDGDGLLESGESAEILLTVENLGDGAAAGVIGVASAPATGFFLTNDTASFGAITSDGAVQAGPLEVLSTGGTTNDLSFQLTLSDTYGTTLLARTIDVVAPAPPDTITFEPRATTMRVIWPVPDEDDLRGYHVFRSLTDQGPFVALTDASVDHGSFFVDAGLAELTRYYYRVSSVDWSGNESAQSVIVSASTSAPQLEGWPISLPSGLSKGSPTPIDFDRDGLLEIAIGWTQPMIFSASGGDYIDGDGNALTLGIFADLEDGQSKFWNSPAVADIDRDGVNEIVFAAWHTTGEGYLYVLDATGAVEPGWPQEIGKAPWSTPAIGDTDHLAGMEIFVSSGAGSGVYQGVLFGFRHDGTEIVDGDANPATHGVFYKSASAQAKFMYGSPALADLTNDGAHEVVFLEKTKHSDPSHATLYAFAGDGSILPGFPYDDPSTLGSTSSPAVADFDGDGLKEIVAITENKIHVVRADGTDAPGWPKSLPEISSASAEIRDFLSSPAIGDVTGDGALDIAFGWREGNVYLYDGASGALHPGFPAHVIDGDGEFDAFLRSPILGNLDADPLPEIIVATGDNRLVAVNADGSVLSGFPLELPGVVYGSAAVCDADGDGFVNLVVQTDAPVLSVFDFVDVPWVPSENPWQMFRHNVAKTGSYFTPTVVDVSETNDAAPAVSSVLAPRPNPAGAGPIVLPFQVGTGTDQVRMRVFDVTGRIVRTLADGRFPSGRYRISWDGRRATGDPIPAGTYFVRTEIGRDVFDRKITIVR